MWLASVSTCLRALALPFAASVLALPATSALTDADYYGLSPPVYPSPAGTGRGPWAAAYDSARHLVGQMTLEEKVNITRGFHAADNVCAGNTGTVSRLGWPGMCLHDAANGVRATDLVNAYPSGIHAGASWDKNLTYLRGWYMGLEFKTKGGKPRRSLLFLSALLTTTSVNVLLGPNAGPLGRIPLGGRNWEGFSVDPYLSGQLNAEAIRGHQDAGVIASVKHLVGNEQETYRRPYFGIEAASSNIDDRTLHEYYLWPFMDAVRAGAGSVMCSYNRLNNSNACQNSKLLNGLLKSELAFEGFVLSDWNGQHSGVASALAGLDMVMPDEGYWGDNLTEAVRNGSVSDNRVTDMAQRIIASWYFLDQDGPGFPEPGVGLKNLTLPHKQVDARSPESKSILLEGAIAGHVLVKNEKGALPFRKPPTMLSIFGYDATVPDAKNTGTLFDLGYWSSPEMAHAALGTEQHFSQAAMGGTVVVGGRGGTNAPPYISDPLSAISQRASVDGTWVNWDLRSGNPVVNAASDACLVFINAIATEGWDRDGLHDDFSDGLVLNVASKCANTIVVIHAAGTRLVDQWIDHPNITAVIIAHLPGQDSGAALVKLLYGETNFSGKLPYTMPRNESDYSVYAPCRRNSSDDMFPQCDFAEAVYLDYRDFDARDAPVRYEFGFGLSYTTFTYSALSVQVETSSGDRPFAMQLEENGPDPVDDDDNLQHGLWEAVVTVHIDVVNAGTAPGAEAAQLYLGIPDRPPKQLRGFEKTPLLRPGQSASVTFELTRRDVSVWDVVAQRWVVQAGAYAVYVGASSRDIRATGGFVVRKPDGGTASGRYGMEGEEQFLSLEL